LTFANPRHGIRVQFISAMTIEKNSTMTLFPTTGPLSAWKAGDRVKVDLLDNHPYLATVIYADPPLTGDGSSSQDHFVVMPATVEADALKDGNLPLRSTALHKFTTSGQIHKQRAQRGGGMSKRSQRKQNKKTPQANNSEKFLYRNAEA